MTDTVEEHDKVEEKPKKWRRRRKIYHLDPVIDARIKKNRRKRSMRKYWLFNREKINKWLRDYYKKNREAQGFEVKPRIHQEIIEITTETESENKSKNIVRKIS